jgi:hypothetical protein
MKEGRMDTTGIRNNGGVVPPRTEVFSEKPVRYTNSDVQGHYVGRIAGCEAINSHKGNEQRKSLQCAPTGFGNPWGRKRHTHDSGVMKDNWFWSEDYAGVTETIGSDPSTDSTAGFAAEDLLKYRVASAQTDGSHSKETREKQSAMEKDPNHNYELLSSSNGATRDNV